jgi:hypothetical protein
LVSTTVPTNPERAWTTLVGMDLTRVSQPWGPIPGVVAIRDQPSRFFDEPGHRRVLQNSDGSTLVETIEALDPPHSLHYTITELTNRFRRVTRGARARFEFESTDGSETRITWRYTWMARNAVSLPVLWLVAHLAFRPYMRRMLGRIAAGAAP